MTTPTYHGCDSNTAPSSDSCTDNFYLGEMGMGAFVGDSHVYNPNYGCFNNVGNTGNTNTNAEWMYERNRQNTYGYWFLLGPQLANPDYSPSTYTCSGQSISGYRSYSVTTTADAYTWGRCSRQHSCCCMG